MLDDAGVTNGQIMSVIVLPPDGIALDTVEAELAKQAYERAGGNLTKAAKLLDISRDQLRYKLKKSGSYVIE
jgi:DNA-binding NtrC family response regulator